MGGGHENLALAHGYSLSTPLGSSRAGIRNAVRNQSGRRRTFAPSPYHPSQPTWIPETAGDCLTVGQFDAVDAVAAIPQTRDRQMAA